MDLGRLRGTDYVVGALALALLGSLFLDWYTPGTGAAPVNAFGAFAVTDVVLAAFAVMALGIVAITVTQQSAAVPMAWTALTALASLVAIGFVLPATLGLPEDGWTREVGPVAGLALTVALAGAVWSAMRNERPGPSLARSRRAQPETLPTPRP